MKHSRRWIVVALAFLGLVWLLVHSVRTNPEWRAFDGRLFLHSLLSVEKSWMGWGLVAIYLTYVVRALRWKLLMRDVKPDARLWHLLSATMIGFAAIGLFGRAGEMVRPYLVARKEGVPVSSQVAVWLMERSFDTLTVLVGVALALRYGDVAGLRSSPTLSRVVHTAGAMVGYGTLVMVAVIVALTHFSGHAAQWVIDRLHHLPARFRKLEQMLVAFGEGSRALRSLPALAGCILYSLLEWALVAFCYNAVFNACSGGLRLSVNELLIFMGCVMGGSLVQIPGVGGGAQVASLLALTEVLGVRPEAAASISLLIWAFTFLAVIPPALFLAFHEGLSWRKLRKLESEA
jgi:glycosyltransferase 2 family protein